MTGQDIKKYIEERGISVEIFSTLSKIHRNTLYRYMSGDKIREFEANKIRKKIKGINDTPSDSN